ncbi:family 20 glycosylhydrolase [Vallitalea okinawensis]|uniref:family 20 glycosylhydrolase n=1 Tax=Vallitalea okinawensis TaxID=2078660 RepID=UPI000CFC6B53|nr:family 20 glycosylhydrolase [Vallitalea okinawensis]
MYIRWNKVSTPKELYGALKILGDYFDVHHVPEGKENVVFIKGGEGLRLQKKEVLSITYESMQYAMRGCLILLFGRLVTPDYIEKSLVPQLTCMLDNSRNAVTTVKALKEFMVKLSLMGYSRLMLYTEDMYEISEVPAFGYLRGKYTKKELRELNDFGKLLGIELVGCIQTLGHLQQLFHWKYFSQVQDGIANLMVDNEETYQLIDLMLQTMSEVFDSKVIALGMDEVHSLGRGKYIDKFGFQGKKELFLRHIKKVKEIANQHGYKETYLWSDMFIKMNSSNHSYYEPDTVTFKPEFIDSIEDITLGFWNYDEVDSEQLILNLKLHEKLKRKTILVSGLYTYFTTHYDHNKSAAHLDAVYETVCQYPIQELMLAIWGDDGAYCDPASYSLGLYYLAEKIYCKDQINKEKFNYLFKYDYHIMERLSDVNYKAFQLPNLYFDDPILGIGYNNELRKDKDVWYKALQHYQDLEKYLSKHESKHDTYKYASIVCNICKYKILARTSLITAYKEDESLFKDNLEYYKVLISLTKDLAICHRRIWMKNFKTYGFDVMQVRYGGMISRYHEAILYVNEYLKGIRPRIPELDEINNGLEYKKIKAFYKNIAHATVVQ